MFRTANFAAPILSLAAALGLTACASQPINRVSDEPLETVASVDTERYLGRWYEIARLPNRFEKDCEGVTADYSRRDDGLIRVVNTCRKSAADGKIDVANGRARIVDTTSNAKLEVSFFGPFWGDYWIIRLADDYSLSIVSEPGGRYLWVLSRTPTIDETTWTDVLAFLEAEGFDTSKLYFPQQPPVPDNPRAQ